MPAADRKKVALVTGASSGIGFATSIELAKRGYVVFAGARRLEPMARLREDYGVNIFKLDVTDLQSVKEAKSYIEKVTGTSYLDILFNNAGQICTMPATDVTDKQVEQCFEVNVFGAMRMVREFVPLLINAKGLVAFTGSIAGVNPFPFQSTYTATKAAIESYASVLRIELKPFGVKVINLITGLVGTNIEDTRDLPETSLYNVPGMEESFEENRKSVTRNNPTPADVYARQVVKDFENAKLGGSLHLYRGKMGFLLGFVAPLLPRTIHESTLIRSLKLDGPFEYIKKKYSSGTIA
ncbi:AYR1 [Candida theae]|uniref:AYR1 n=1 Tax=Candida theae TaxID=1198502 RepID=A0AAD5BAX9_9ASCO|nr:AYR1 [Candida theae]KAI5949948.1 AYR1 [Candida theae]